MPRSAIFRPNLLRVCNAWQLHASLLLAAHAGSKLFPSPVYLNLCPLCGEVLL